MKHEILPSLTSINVFEAAAQHLSFVRAARQLGVQSPAVSRQVAELEQALGARLFVRSKLRLALTPLVGFYQQYPEIELHLTTRDSTTNLDPADADVAIMFGEDDLPGVEASRIFREKMLPFARLACWQDAIASAPTRCCGHLYCTMRRPRTGTTGYGCWRRWVWSRHRRNAV